MPTRAALLISNAGEPGDEHYCKGVAVDIANYRRFLTSAHGGAWKTDEIATLDKPSLQQLRDAISAIKYKDYSFVAFAGHGYYSTIDRATVLKLQKNVDASSLELYKDATKRTIVLDCCRELRERSALLMEKSASLNLSRAEASYRRVPNPVLCRATFDSRVLTASKAIVALHSCSPGETAGDDELTGGYYTFNLISSGDAWAKRIADNSNLPIPDSCSVVQAHDLATTATTIAASNKSKIQNPRIEKPRTESNYFPFAVFA